MRCQVFEVEYYYICHDGSELHHIHTESMERDGYIQTRPIQIEGHFGDIKEMRTSVVLNIVQERKKGTLPKNEKEVFVPLNKEIRIEEIPRQMFKALKRPESSTGISPI